MVKYASAYDLMLWIYIISSAMAKGLLLSGVLALARDEGRQETTMGYAHHIICMCKHIFIFTYIIHMDIV